MSSLTSQLITEGERPKVASAAPPSDRTPDEGGGDLVVPTSDSQRDALAAAKTAQKIASRLCGQMEKVAQDGGEVDESVGELRETLEKVAHYIPELVKLAATYKKHAEFYLDHAAQGATREEAMKLASEMLADGLLEVPDGRTFADMVEELSGEDLGVFKKAHDLVASGRFTRVGEVDEEEKMAGESSRALGDSDEASEHDWLLQ